MLHSVVWQNFARTMPSGEILHTLQSLAAAASRYRLTYDEPGPAIAVLQQHFGNWAGPPASVPEYRPRPTPRGEAVPCPNTSGATLYRQRDGVFAHTVDGQSFLADADGVAIHHLNETAATIWNVLANPMSLPQVVELFQSAFPDQPADSVADDVVSLVNGLEAKQLLEPLDSTDRNGLSP
jgi:hypothetical protein